MNAGDFDGVLVTVPKPSSDASLTLKILSDGEVVKETSEATTAENSDAEVYELSVGETFDPRDFL